MRALLTSLKWTSGLNYPIYGIFSNKIVGIIESFSARLEIRRKIHPLVAH